MLPIEVYTNLLIERVADILFRYGYDIDETILKKILTKDIKYQLEELLKDASVKE